MDNEKISFKVTPSIIDDRFIKIDTRIGDICKEFYSRLIDTEETAVRKALIKLGWTPPSDEHPLSSSWVCSGCGETVEPEDVTFEETHDTRSGGCGADVKSVNKRPLEKTDE